MSAPPVFFFGAMSPYSWFSAERIDGLLPEARWQGVLAGAVFKANGRASWGFGPDREAKIADCEQRAAAQGLGPIRWPEPWPTRDLLTARAMVQAEREGCLRELALAAMRMAFLEGVDLGELAAVLEAGERAGLRPAALEAAIDSEELKAELRAATEKVVSAGVFGVPTVLVGTQLFWGDDRLEDAAAASAAG